MDQSSRSQIGELWLALAEMYGKDLKRPTITLMINAIQDLDPSRVIWALGEWPKTTKVDRHPYPSEVRLLIEPKLDSKFVAMDIARRIDRALIDHGHVWERGYFFDYDEDRNAICYFIARTKEGAVSFWSFKEAVIAELGEIGWHAICSRGGWATLISSQKDMQEGTFIAQLRDQVQASYELAKSGVDVSLIALPEAKRDSNLLQMFPALVKDIDQ